MHPLLQKIAPQHALSRFAGWLANSEIPWLKNYLIRYFINRYSVNMAEATQSDPFQYKSYNDFFTRALKSGTRPIANGLQDFVSPADGCISQLGAIETGLLLQAKGHHFSLRALLAGDENDTSAFQTGRFMTVYLAPPDYHRIHMPVDGYLTEMRYIPGDLFSVNQRTVQDIPNLFARNERVVALFNTSHGRMAMVLVGAMIVGSIETVWSGTVTSGSIKEIQTFTYKDPIFLRRGEEMGRFKLGSTVIVLTESSNLQFNLGLEAETRVQMGQQLGEFSVGSVRKCDYDSHSHLRTDPLY